MKIGVVALSGPVSQAPLEAGLKVLEGWGHQLVLGENLNCQNLLTAGDPGQRINALAEVLARRPDFLWCARGGSGLMDLLPQMENLDFSGLSGMVGYSDLTPLFPLLRSFNSTMNLLHGPMVVDLADPDGFCESSLLQGLKGTFAPIKGHTKNQAESASGMIRGGCLSMVSAVMGTSYSLDPEASLLFLEDVGEPLYRLDRMICQLELAGWPEKVAGIVLGQFSRCFHQGKQFSDLEMGLWLEQRFMGWKVPLVSGLEVGHGTGKKTLPLEVPGFIQGNILTFRN